LGAGVGEAGPAETACGADGDGGGAGEGAAVPPVGGGVDAPTTGITGTGSGGGGHGGEGGGLKDIGGTGKAIDLHEEAQEVGGMGKPAAVGIHAADVHAVGVLSVLTVIDDFVLRAVAERIAGDLHVPDVASGEHALPEVLGIGGLGDFFDDATEQAVAKVGVGVLFSGSFFQGNFTQGPGDQFGMIHLRVHEHGVTALIVPASGGVGEEVMDGDGLELIPIFPGPEFREEAVFAKDVIVEFQLALLNQGIDGDGSDGLGDAGDAEAMIDGESFFLLGVGKAKATAIDPFSPICEGDGEARGVELFQEVLRQGADGCGLFCGWGGDIVCGVYLCAVDQSAAEGGGEGKALQAGATGEGLHPKKVGIAA